MAALNKAIDKQSLQGLSPLDKLSHNNIDDIISKSRVENLPAGRIVFRQGEDDGQTIYLLSGQIELSIAGKTEKQLIKGKSAETRQPLAAQVPRPATARTKTAVSLLYIDSSLLEILLDDNPSGEYEVTEIDIAAEHTTGWMMRFLQSRTFLKLPTENIQKILMCMEEVHANNGDNIFQQGEEGDYYYIIKSGHCAVLRRPAEKAEEICLAKLAEGDGFGEEALITNNTRNATVKMLDNGTLMRLKKDDFLSLLVTPLIKKVHLNSLKSSLYNNSIVLDVRINNESGNDDLGNAKHIPLSMLRLRIPTLDAKRPYLIYADNNDNANAASFLLAQQGIESMVILGSLQQPQTIIQPPLKTETETTTGNAASDNNITAPTNESQNKQNPAREAQTHNMSVTAVPVSVAADKSPESVNTDRPENPQDNADQQRQQKSRQETEELRLAVKKETERMLTEAEEIRQTAIQDALRLRHKIEKEETLKLRTELEDTRNRAEMAIKKSEQLAKQICQQAEQESTQIRQQAEAESSQIRQQALEEAERLRKELAQLREQEAQMKQSIESELPSIRQRAAELARLDAEREAEKARLAAKQAADLTRTMAIREAEQTRVMIEQHAEKSRKESEQVRMAALREADEARCSAEQTAAETRAAADRLSQELKAIEQQVEQARLKAEQEAAAIRQAALEEANQIKQSALAESEQIKKNQITETKPFISHDNIFNFDEELSPTVKSIQPYADEASVALQMAREIKAGLVEIEEQRIVNKRDSISQSTEQKARLRNLSGKIILEGEEDVFIFMEPMEPDSSAIEQAVLQATTATSEQTPAKADSQGVPDELSTADTTPELSNSPELIVDRQYDIPPANNKNKLALVAGIFLVISLSLAAYTTKIQINFTEVGALGNQESQATEEAKVKERARSDFQKKVSAINKM